MRNGQDNFDTQNLAEILNSPLIVLTTSQAEVDIVSSYKLLASCYLTKPGALKEFESLVKSLNEFWLTRAKLPKQGAPLIAELPLGS